MPNVWNATLNRWEDPEHQNYQDPNGVWTNQQGGQYVNGQWGQPNVSTIMAPRPTNPNAAIWGAQNNVLSSTANSIGAQGNYLGAQGNALAARGGVLTAQSNGLDARGGVLAAMLARRAPQQQVRQAQGAVVGAQEQETAATRGFIQQQQAHNAVMQQQVADLKAAHNNVADILAVGKQKNLNNAEDRRYSEFGLAAPTEVALPDGSNPILATGTRAAPQTQESVLSSKFDAENKATDLRLEGARQAVALIGTNVDAARNAAARAGLTLDEANALVDEAKLTEEGASIGTARAGLNEDNANLLTSRAGNAREWATLGGQVSELGLRSAEQSPAPGLERWTDPNTGAGEWLTPAEKDRRDYAYSQGQAIEHIPQNYTLQQRRETFGNQQSPLAGFSESELGQILLNDPSYESDPSKLLPLIDELVRRGYTRQQAQYKIGQLATAAEAARSRASGGGGGGTQITPPAYGQ